MMMAAESPAARCEAAVSQTLLYGRPLPLADVSARVRRVERQAVQQAARQAVSDAEKGFAAAAAIGPASGLAAAPLFTASFA
jgi:predicted Zn-dependent peptidase